MGANYKRYHDTTNVIIQEQEKSILSIIGRAKASSSNSQIIGSNGEIPLLNFLNDHLPYTLKAVSGHFVTPTGKRSPQIDILIADSRYHFLNINLDGSVLAMMHSVLSTTEVKTNVTSSDIKKSAKTPYKSTHYSKISGIGEDRLQGRSHIDRQ